VETAIIFVVLSHQVYKLTHFFKKRLVNCFLIVKLLITGVTVEHFQAIRVVANLSISPEAGAGLAANEVLVDLLIQILGMLLNLK